MTRAELIMRAAEAAHFSSGSRATSRSSRVRWPRSTPMPAPEQRAMFLERLGRVNWTHLRGAQAVAAYEQAVALLADRPPSAEQAFTLSALGQSLMLRDQYRQAEAVLRRAIAVAQAVGAPATEGHALCSLGPALVWLGRVDDGLAAMYRAQELCRGARHDRGCLPDLRQSRARPVHLWPLRRGGAGRCRRAGLRRSHRAPAALRRRHHRQPDRALFLAGRWPEAARPRPAFELQVPRAGRVPGDAVAEPAARPGPLRARRGRSSTGC